MGASAHPKAVAVALTAGGHRRKIAAHERRTKSTEPLCRQEVRLATAVQIKTKYAWNSS